jgi:L-seryl-tRNA(Ser) seleniumtransferase
VLADPRLASLIARFGATRVKETVQEAQDALRRRDIEADGLVDRVLTALDTAGRSLRPVVNATGVVLHTNLGRAALSPTAVDALVRAAGYVDVEYELRTGRRARRGRGALQALRTAVPAAGDVLVVNNGAAALVLAVTALAAGERAEVVMSRGELIEIGDGFRLPDLITSTGARIVEVGTTNRTTLDDYGRAIGARTACVVKVHPSNFRVEGFTAAVPVRQLAGLAAPLVVDTGSGLLAPDPLLPDEPDVASALADGADLVLCSGDKLLGGPQSGLLFGQADLIERLRRHPLARALRVDKLTLAALEATVAGPLPPTHDYLRADADRLQARARAVVDTLPDRIGADVVPSDGAVGGGGAPGLPLPGWAISLPAGYCAALRQGPTPVAGRVERERCLLDLRCVDPDQDVDVGQAVRDAEPHVRAG